MSELNAYMRGNNRIGDYLCEIYETYAEDHFAFSKVIWDISAIAYLLDERWTPTNLVHSPILTDQVTWSGDAGRHLIRYVHHIERDPIFRDLFGKLAGLGV